ncbi:class I adenylate-forming enzyme family protein [Comamonas composti]|uniref:class I adenylate-forming enzyme family protein n=1 Tax=Comamonas composti TaxID=408558 RepID=UPI0004272D42|nr:AMP-binding protein [Comamonas composti]
MNTQQFPQTVGQALDRTAARHHKTAYIDRGRSYSWQEVQQMSAVLARNLRALGLGKGDRIGVILPNGIEWVLTYLAAARMGAVVVGLSIRYRDSELDFMMQDSQIKAVLAPLAFAELDYVQYLSQARERCPTLEHLMFLGDPGEGRGHDFLMLLKAQAAVPDSQEESVEADDLLLIIYTSGTTGKPKAAGLTHGSQLASARAQCEHTKACADDLLQLSLPLNHVGGITCGVLTLMLAGAGAEFVPVFNADTVLEMAGVNPPTMLTGVPTMFALLLLKPEFASADWSRLRLVIIGGSNVEPGLLSRLQQLLPGVVFMNLYGLSETSGAIVMTPWNADQHSLLHSIGRPLAGAEVCVAGPDGRPLPAGEVGELCYRSASVIPGYVGAQRDEGAFDALGWLHSGDLGYLDEQGQIYLMGRKKDMFIQGGFNVYPAEVEGVLGLHPGVLMAAGLGVPDPVLGEVGRYYVVAKPGVELSEAELQAHCLAHLADYKAPRQIVFRSELPMTPAGKIQKALLRGSP